MFYVLKRLVINLIKSFIQIPHNITIYFRGVFSIIRDTLLYSSSQSKHKFPIKNSAPVIFDKYKQAGSIDAHYFLQDIYVAQKVLENSPTHHYDVGSRVDGFISHLLTALKDATITLIDIRPLSVTIPHLDFIQADATLLEGITANSLSSLSSLHAVEHFGLGRYGDSVNPDACFMAMQSLQRVVASGGYLYFSVPIGHEDITVFNSHRIFTPKTVIDTFSEMELVEFSYINNYKLTTIQGSEVMSLISNKKLNIHEYDCGIFIFKKH